MPDPSLKPTRLRARNSVSSVRARFGPLDRRPSGRWEVALLALCVFCLSCSERLTPSRAGTIIRHSKAFLSGSPESHPVFDGVSALLAGVERSTPERDESDSYIAVFTYHWPEERESEAAGRSAPELTARAVLRRSGNSWAVDDNQSRALDPSWPRLPRTLSSFWPDAGAIPGRH